MAYRGRVEPGSREQVDLVGSDAPSTTVEQQLTTGRWPVVVMGVVVVSIVGLGLWFGVFGSDDTDGGAEVLDEIGPVAGEPPAPSLLPLAPTVAGSSTLWTRICWSSPTCTTTQPSRSKAAGSGYGPLPSSRPEYLGSASTRIVSDKGSDPKRRGSLCASGSLNSAEWADHES